MFANVKNIPSVHLFLTKGGGSTIYRLPRKGHIFQYYSTYHPEFTIVESGVVVFKPR